MHSIIKREPTGEERKRLARLRKPDVASYGCMIALSVGPIWLLGILGSWIESLVSEDPSNTGQRLGWIVGVVLLVILLVCFTRYDRRQRQLAAADERAGIIEEIHVTDPRVIEIDFIGNNGPILAFDISDDKVLFLQGQWLEHHQTYGVDEPGDEEHEKIFNGLKEPHSFPSTEFTITRFLHSGEVCKIRVSGNYVSPEGRADAMDSEFRFRPSEIFDGSIDHLTEALLDAHNHRTNG